MGHTPRILLVEPDRTNRSDLSECLATLGFPVLSEPVLSTALSRGRDFRPDLAIVDVGSSEATTDPADVVQEALGVPVVAVTTAAAGPPGDLIRGSSAFGYLAPPFTSREVGTVVELALHRHRMERVLALSEARFRLLFDRNPAGVVVESVDGRILECNEALASMLGYETPGALQGQPASTLFQDPLDDLERRRCLADGGTVHHQETRLRHRSGRAVWAVDNAVLVPDPMTGRGQILRTLLDITERKAVEEGLERLAYRDPLTGLPNRRLLEIRAEQTLAEAKRRGERAAVVFMDLIGFKGINDQIGHRAGDELLVEVAKRLVASLRRTDAAARFGGDEFMVLLSGVEDVPGAAQGAERILSSLAAPLTVMGHELTVQARAGVAVYPDHARTFDQMVTLADAALTRAKGAGGRVVVLAHAPRRPHVRQGVEATDAGAL